MPDFHELKKRKRKKLGTEIDAEFLERAQKLAKERDVTFRELLEYSIKKTLKEFGDSAE